MAYVNQTHAVETGFAARAAAFFADLGTRYMKYRLYRETLAELGSLSDRELNDLGLARANLRSIATESVYGA
ncbi:MAG: DUF1127 domain-containing protein [Pseudomonadota bacterium]